MSATLVIPKPRIVVVPIRVAGCDESKRCCTVLDSSYKEEEETEHQETYLSACSAIMHNLIKLVKVSGAILPPKQMMY